MAAQAFIFDGSSATQADMGAVLDYSLVTFACWVKVTATTSHYGVFGGRDDATGPGAPAVFLHQYASNGPYCHLRTDAGGEFTQNGGGGWTPGTGWEYWAARYNDSTHHMKYSRNTTHVDVDLGAGGFSMSGFLRYIAMGVRNATGGADTDNRFNGKIAHPCFWQAYVSDANIDLLAGGDNPLTVETSLVKGYWYDSKTPHTGGATFSDLSGTVTLSGADLPTVDDPPGGDVSTGLSGSALTGGSGTHAPGHNIALRERLRQRFVSLPGRSILVPGWLAARTKFA